MIKRNLTTWLNEFYSSHRQAVLLTGARQTGKTFAIRILGKNRFKSFVEINFLENPDAKRIFEGVQSATEIINRISVFTSQPLVKGNTLIFFDEVQECPECVTCIKFLVDEGSYRYALSGSLLGVELKDLRSEPVGYMEVKEVFPLDFEEFALAIGVSPQVMHSLRESFADRVAVDDIIHRQMLRLFQLYLVVGGMPAAVSKYLENNNLQEVITEQKSIIHLYARDIGKYDKKTKLILNEIYSLIPSELDAKTKRFILKKVDGNIKFSRTENSFLWLKDAGVALPTYNVSEPRLPLLLNELRSLFKLFLNDVGLLCSQYANGIQLKLLSNECNINYGAVYENVVAQELHAHGFSLHYFNSKQLGEVDFIVESDGRILPIEVKSGKNYKIHRALSNLLNSSAYDIPEAFVFCNDNLSSTGKVLYLPIYMITFLRVQDDLPLQVYRPDISALR